MKSLLTLRRAFGVMVFFLGCVFRAQADVVLEWNDTLLRFGADAAAHAPSPHLQARTLAMTHLAIDAAVNAAAKITRDEPARRALQRGAAAAAARDLLERLQPVGGRPFAALAARHLAALDPAALAVAERLGREAAMGVWQQREGDGWVALAMLGAITLVPDSSAAAADALARGENPPASPWNALTPFVLKQAGQIAASPLFVVNAEGRAIVDFTLQRSRLFNLIDRTVPIDAVRSAWSHAPWLAWNRVAHAALANAPLDVAGESRVFALLNLALSDALLAAEHWRFTLGSWQARSGNVWEELDGRAVLATDTVVQATDGLTDRLVRQQAVRILIPPQRDFPSSAATLAGAAQAALVACWKTDRLGFTVLPPPPAQGSRSYAGFDDAAREAAFAASLDGRHCREACVSGYQLGAKVGDYVVKRSLAARVDR